MRKYIHKTGIERRYYSFDDIYTFMLGSVEKKTIAYLKTKYLKDYVEKKLYANTLKEFKAILFVVYLSEILKLPKAIIEKIIAESLIPFRYIDPVNLTWEQIIFELETREIKILYPHFITLLIEKGFVPGEDFIIETKKKTLFLTAINPSVMSTYKNF